jgi:Tol biopolymer transport system component
MPSCLSVPELVSGGIVLRPVEAVAIVSEVCRQCLEGRAYGIPSPSAIRVIADGTVEIRGPAISGQAAVVRAAHLLNALLPPFDAPPEYRAPGGLRLVIARALGTVDLPPYASLEEFTHALARFSVRDARDEVRGLFRDWERAQTAALPVATTGRTASAARFGRGRRGLRYAASVAIPVSAAALLTLLEVNPPSAGTTAPPARPTPVAAARHAPTVTAPSSPRIIQAAAFSPTFARGGTAVYFHQQRDGVSTLHRADTDGRGDVTNVTNVVSDRARNFHPRPSPDGSRIAFDSDREGTRAVYVAHTDGSDPRRISGAGFAAVPTWSPDGTQLAFVRAEPRASRVWNLWIADADGSNLTRLTNHRVGQAWGGSWFPDGRAIAYSVETRLVVLDLVTGARRTFDSPRRGRLVRTPAVAPDGRRIIFQVHRDGAWVVDVESGRMQRVLSDPTAEEFTWSPDGQRVAFHSYRTGEWSVWVMAP